MLQEVLLMDTGNFGSAIWEWDLWEVREHWILAGNLDQNGRRGGLFMVLARFTWIQYFSEEVKRNGRPHLYLRRSWHCRSLIFLQRWEVWAPDWPTPSVVIWPFRWIFFWPLPYSRGEIKAKWKWENWGSSLSSACYFGQVLPGCVEPP